MTRDDWHSHIRYVADRSLRRPGPGLLLGGSPTRLLRLSPAGDAVLDRLLDTGRTPPGDRPARLVDRMAAAGMLHPIPDRGVVDLGISVVIPVHDQSSSVADAVEAGLQAGAVTVVDDASTDESGRVAEEAGATVLTRSVNGGPAAARNTGAASSEGEIIVFVDADCVPGPGCIARLLDHFIDPSVGVVVPRVRGQERASGLLMRYEDARSPIDMGPTGGAVRPDGRISFVPTAVMAVRRSAFEHVGGFDEGLRFGEDVDLVWRLHEAGWTVRYVAEAEAFHRHRTRPIDVARRRFGYGGAAGPLARRHPRALAAVRASPWTLAVWASLLLGKRWTAIGLFGWSWIGLRRSLPDIPGRNAVVTRLVLAGTAGAFPPLASSLTRYWAPLTLVAACTSRAIARRLGLAVLGVKTIEWLRRRPALDPVTYTALAVVDDLVFCAGTLEGCRRAGTVLPLLPRTGRPEVGRRSGKIVRP